tara:strand:+ start:112 stop:246 length:135 start_codon:yes stop_codon:yes gene_type:complete
VVKAVPGGTAFYFWEVFYSVSNDWKGVLLFEQERNKLLKIKAKT